MPIITISTRLGYEVVGGTIASDFTDIERLRSAIREAEEQEKVEDDVLKNGLKKECIHCLHKDVIRSSMSNMMLFGSDSNFCTNCGCWWDSPSVECYHCGTLGED